MFRIFQDQLAKLKFSTKNSKEITIKTEKEKNIKFSDNKDDYCLNFKKQKPETTV